jgi:23S rRNA (adenine2030-N6)-methyltransferase
LLWYPIKERDVPEALARRLRRLGLPKLLRSEMTLRAPRADAALAGSGLMVVNPPHTLERDLEILLPLVIQVLSPSATQRLDWLVGEQQRSPRGPVAKR